MPACATSSQARHGRVQVVSKTWATERHDLFDFEAGQADLVQQEFTVSDSAACFRKGTDVEVAPMLAVNNQSEETQCLLGLVRRGGSFRVEKAPTYSSVRPWLVVKDMPGGQHVLREGEHVRLGCVRMRVKQLALGNSSSEEDAQLPNLPLEPSCRANPGSQEEMESKLCRICMCEGPGEDDPLIAPCSCKGSVEFVHLGCLRKWIDVRRKPSATPSAYSVQSLPCDMCKTPYANSVSSATGVSPLVQVPPLKPPFAVLELRERRGPNNGTYVLSFADQKVMKLGRTHNIDVRIQDPSISRWHASLRLTDAGIVLEDNASKFGTLVELKKQSVVDVKCPVSVQIGRTVLQLSPEEMLTPRSETSDESS